MKISKNIEVEITKDTFLYDLATESIKCSLCGLTKWRTRLNGEVPEKLDDMFQNFTFEHFDCLLKRKTTGPGFEEIFGAEAHTFRKTC